MLDQQAVETMRPFVGPIPGQSLTNSPDSQQPYEGAPEYTNVKVATEAIFLSLLEEDMLKEVARMMTEGTPIGDITKMLLVSGLSQGKYNADLMLLLVEPVMYMLLAIAERLGITNIKIDRDDTDEEEIEEPLTDEERQVDLEQGQEMRRMLTREEQPRFSDLKANVAPDQIPQELMNKLDNIDVAGIREGLMARPEPREQGTESLMSREGFAGGGLAGKLLTRLLKKHRKDPEIKKLTEAIKEQEEWIKQGGPAKQRKETEEFTIKHGGGPASSDEWAELSDEFADYELAGLKGERERRLKDLESDKYWEEEEIRQDRNFFRKQEQEGGLMSKRGGG